MPTYLYKRANQTHGPITWPELVTLYSKGAINHETLIRETTQPGFASLRSLPIARALLPQVRAHTAFSKPTVVPIVNTTAFNNTPRPTFKGKAHQ